MTFTAVVTSHDNPEGLEYTLENLSRQSRLSDEALVYISPEIVLEADAALPFAPVNIANVRPRVRWVPDRQDWGHEKRAMGLAEARGDYVGFFNDDDMYDLTYIEKMMAAAEAGADVVYCDWSGIRDCTFCLGSSTSGNYIVRAELGRWVGYTDRHYEADGTFIDRIREADLDVMGPDGLYRRKPRIVKVPQLLYWHNQQR